MIEIGDTVIWSTNLDDPSQIHSGTVTRLKGDVAWVDRLHGTEDCIYAANLLPARVRAEYEQILAERQKLKRAYDDSLKLIFELRNAITRGEK